jgi:TonB family protein
VPEDWRFGFKSISQAAPESRLRSVTQMEKTHTTTELQRPRMSLINKQNLRLLAALSILVVALTVVLVKDREFWFGPDEAIESDGASETVAKTGSAAVPAQAAPAPVTPVAAAKNQVAQNQVAQKAAAPANTAPATKDVAKSVAANSSSANPASASQASPVVASKRVVLPSLDVEVVAGDNHRTVHPGSNVATVEIPGDANRFSASTTSVTTNAAERESLSVTAPAGTISGLRQNVDATYPLLGQHMRVQGSVVLQAIIGADGVIENLRVVSGPAILATAAQQAVRQWRFKPYLQNGQPVETKTNITVNFSIRVADNAAKTS